MYIIIIIVSVMLSKICFVRKQINVFLRNRSKTLSISESEDELVQEEAASSRTQIGPERSLFRAVELSQSPAAVKHLTFLQGPNEFTASGALRKRIKSLMRPH